MSLRFTTMIDGKPTRQIVFLNTICANLSPTKCLSEKKHFSRISNLEVYLVMPNVILKYPGISEKLLPIFHPSSRTLLFVGRDDSGLYMKEYAQKVGLLTQPRKLLISSSFLENETIITSSLLFHLDLVLVCKKLKVYCFVQYTPMKCFNNFVQFAVNA